MKSTPVSLSLLFDLLGSSMQNARRDWIRPASSRMYQTEFLRASLQDCSVFSVVLRFTPNVGPWVRSYLILTTSESSKLCTLLDLYDFIKGLLKKNEKHFTSVKCHISKNVQGGIRQNDMHCSIV